MNTKQRNQLWRLPLFFMIIIAIVYQITWLIAGPFPALTHFSIFQDVGNQVSKLAINLPMVISRYWDLVFALLVIFLMVINNQSKDEETDFVDMNYYSFFAIFAVITVPITFVSMIQFIIPFSLLLPIPIAIFYSRNIQIKTALFIGLVDGLIQGFIYGILATLLFLIVCVIIHRIRVMSKNGTLIKVKKWLNGEEDKKNYQMRIVKAKKK